VHLIPRPGENRVLEQYLSGTEVSQNRGGAACGGDVDGDVLDATRVALDVVRVDHGGAGVDGDRRVAGPRLPGAAVVTDRARAARQHGDGGRVTVRVDEISSHGGDLSPERKEWKTRTEESDETPLVGDQRPDQLE